MLRKEGAWQKGYKKMVANSFPGARRVCGEVRSNVSSNAMATVSAPLGEDIDRDRWYAEFAPLVRRLIRQYGQDADMREDLTGEIYCRFCALYEAFDPTRGIPLRAYIVRQLTHATYTYARQQWRVRKRESTWERAETRVELRECFDPTDDWLTALTQEQVAALLPDALRQLAPRQRNVVIWRYFEERSFEEMAEMLGVRPVTVRSMLRHGLSNLRKAMQSHDAC